jgi:hypothetical protein
LIQIPRKCTKSPINDIHCAFIHLSPGEDIELDRPQEKPDPFTFRYFDTPEAKNSNLARTRQQDSIDAAFMPLLPNNSIVFKNLRLVHDSFDSVPLKIQTTPPLKNRFRDKFLHFIAHPILRLCAGVVVLIAAVVLSGQTIQIYKNITKWELPRIEYYSHSDIIKRGWTDSMINDLLESPDHYAENQVLRTQNLMRLWRKDRVHQTETTVAFQVKQRKAANRSPRIRALLATKDAPTIGLATIDVPDHPKPEIIPIPLDPSSNIDTQAPKMRTIPDLQERPRTLERTQ